VGNVSRRIIAPLRNRQFFSLYEINRAIAEERDILEIAESRYSKASTVLSGQIPHTQWYDLFPEPMIADAIMDRVIHNAYILALDSKKSMRDVMAEKIIKDIEKNGMLS